MQYDNPNNEEMCKLLDATKLPYMLLYKGSKGKVADFQCGPAKFQMLVDAVNEFADPVLEEENVVVVNENNGGVNGEIHDVKDTATSPPHDRRNATIAAQSEGEDTIDGLKEQLVQLENEKVEMFEIMKVSESYD